MKGSRKDHVSLQDQLVLVQKGDVRREYCLSPCTINLTSSHLMLSGGTTGCSPGCRRRRYCGRTQREATSSDKSSLPAAHQTNPLRQEPAPRQAARPVGGKMQPVGKVETFLEAAKTWAGWTTAWLSSMSSFFYFFTSHERMHMCWVLFHCNNFSEMRFIRRA